MWLPGHTPARHGGMGLRHSRGMQCCPAGAGGSARPYLGPTLLWGQPEGWQLLSTLLGAGGTQGDRGCVVAGRMRAVVLAQLRVWGWCLFEPQGCSILPQPPACPWDIS